MRDAAFERDVATLCALGPRCMVELLREIGADTMRMTAVESLVRRYVRLDAATLRALGGDRLPPRPLHLVPGGRRHG